VTAGRHYGSVPEIFNITENLNSYDLLSVFSDEQYGNLLINFIVDDAEAFSRLDDSDYPEDRACSFFKPSSSKAFLAA
jgi:hypothetical protein